MKKEVWGWLVACCRFALAATCEIREGEARHFNALPQFHRRELHQKCGRALEVVNQNAYPLPAGRLVQRMLANGATAR
jgi:hypothetical protein